LSEVSKLTQNTQIGKKYSAYIQQEQARIDRPRQNLAGFEEQQEKYRSS